jgi:LPPG:FO 2-phospho-L-lactate transferase
MMNIVALAGGVGGAKLAHGLALCHSERSEESLPNSAETLRSTQGDALSNLTIIVNTGDDFELYGLRISPDLDTVTYTLAGLANPDTGWGMAGDTFQFLDALKRLGVDAWFWLGDRDLATHIRRTDLLRQGQTLTEATQLITRSLNIAPTILPMTDDRFRTLLNTDQGRLEFQEYFVHRQWQPRITSIEFDGASTARLTQPAADAIQDADVIIICPSNPFVSIDPILTLTPAPLSLKGRGDSGEGIPIIAVSPIVGGQAIKGPAAKMFDELGFEPSALNVAKHYHGLVTHFVLDQIDASQESAIQLLGMRTLVTDTVMKSVDDRVRLASEILDLFRTA